MFFFQDFYGKQVLKSSILQGLEHLFTTRDFILTSGELSELNDEAALNRKFLCEKLNLPIKKLITVKQTHSCNIEIYDGETSHYDNCDSVISNVEDTGMILNFADCVPIILYSPDKNIASIVHAGWRGTSEKIVKKTITKLISTYNIKRKHIKAAIGPSIGNCCFNVEEDVFNKLITDKEKQRSAWRLSKEKNKYDIDLKELNRNQLLATGIIDIDVCDYCTSCMSDIFFSYRKERGKTARHSAIVKLEKRK